MKKMIFVLAFLLITVPVSARQIILTWTAPADDAGLPTEGPVTAYKLVYSELPITGESFETSTVITTATPKDPGQTESLTIDLADSRHYYFAVKSVDANGNWSLLSNVAQRDFFPPTPVADLH